MTTVDGPEERKMPSMFYSYSHYDLLVRLHEIDLRLTRMETHQILAKEEAFTNYLFSQGGFMIALGLAGYALSFDLPDSHFAPISLFFGIAGMVMLTISLRRLRRATVVQRCECGEES